MEETQKILSPQLREYFALPGLNYSKLKILAQDPAMFKEMYESPVDESEKKHFIDGNLIDALLLDPPLFQKSYIKETWITPSSANQNDYAFARASGRSMVEAYSDAYSTKNKSDKKIQAEAEILEEDLKGYIDYLQNHGDKIGYNAEQEGMIMQIQSNALQHKVVSKLLNHPKRLPHLIIQVNYKGIACKCEIDLAIDLGNVFWIWDLKSTRVLIGNFPGEYRKYRYENQQAYYKKLVEQYLKDQGRTDVKVKVGTIGVSKKGSHGVDSFVPHEFLMEQGEAWVDEQVELFKWHKANGFSYSKEASQNKYRIITPYDFSEDDSD